MIKSSVHGLASSCAALAMLLGFVSLPAQAEPIRMKLENATAGTVYVHVDYTNGSRNFTLEPGGSETLTLRKGDGWCWSAEERLDVCSAPKEPKQGTVSLE